MGNRIIKTKCVGIDIEAKGIIRIKNQEVKVPYLLPNENAEIELIMKYKGTEGKISNIEVASKHREKPKCSYYYDCGGCQLQHMKAKGQRNFKQDLVENIMKKYCKINEIIMMENPYDYRNKVHSTFKEEQKNKVIAGMYEEKSHKLININRCIIQTPKADAIIGTIKELMKSFKMKAFDEDYKRGLLRHVLIKTGFTSKQIMVVLVVGSKMFPSKNNFVKALLKEHPEITTIIMNINDKKTTMILGNVESTIYGKGYIEDTLCGLTFQISSKSFYQINPVQTEILYNKAIEMAKLTGEETVLDAYCGIGTIGIIASKKAKSVIGVELNKEAVNDAIKNAKINNIKNIRFYAKDASAFMENMQTDKQKIDTVFMDPPRDGADKKFLASLINLSPKKIIYISCNPVTQGRDVRILTAGGYVVEEIQPVDMFPQTSHVECVVLMSRVEK